MWYNLVVIKMKKFIKELLPYAIILIVVVLVRSFIATPVMVSGPSMQETLYSNDIMILNKMVDINRYDIVVVKHNKDKIIKRLMGLPGDKIKCVSGTLYINNEEVNQYGFGKNFDFPEVKLGSNEYFVIGDNREDSYDSRYFGPITRDKILGKTDLIIFPFKRIGKVK